MTIDARSAIRFGPRAAVARYGCAILLFVAARILPAAEPPSPRALPGGVAAVELAIESKAMGRPMPVLVLLPPSYAQRPEARYPVLYLLHCAGGDYRMWAQGTGLIRELASRELIVVCPEGTPQGWYLDSPIRPRSAVETHLIRELIPRIDRDFRTLAARSGRAIGGFSMGGHGAVTLAAKHPDLFASASSFGGILDLTRWPGHWGLDAVLGPLAAGREVWIVHSALGLAGRFAKEAAGIKLMIDCGRDDFALPDNRLFHRRLDELTVPHTYRERAGGHEIIYCSRHLPEHLDFHLAAMKEAAVGAEHPAPQAVAEPPAGEPTTGYYTHPAFLKHQTGAGHPERPERLAAIEAALKEKGLWNRLAHPVPKPASLETIGLVHDVDYIAAVRRDIEAGRNTLSTGDTRVSPESWEAALLAAGAVCDAVDAVLSEDFGRLTRILLDLADELCQGRVVIALEGGYDLNALGASVAATIAELETGGRAVRRQAGPPNQPEAFEQPQRGTAITIQETPFDKEREIVLPLPAGAGTLVSYEGGGLESGVTPPVQWPANELKVTLNNWPKYLHMKESTP